MELVQIPYQNNWSDNLDEFVQQLRQSELGKNVFNQPKELQLDDDTIKRNILNGLNMSNKTISDWQDAHNIRKPQGWEEVAQAREGQFNSPLQNALQGSVEDRPTKWDNFLNGYRDNYDNAFRPSNLKKDSSKGWAYRLGEGLGTAGRFIDSPLGRGLLAAGLNSALGYDNSLQEGVTAFLGRQNNVTADKLYRRQLKDYGYTDEDLAQIRGNITTDMYKNLATNLYRNKKLTQDQAAKQMNLVRQMQLARQLDNDTAGALMAQIMQNTDLEGMDINFQDSNQTRNTESQIDYRNKRIEQINRQLDQNDQKIAILQQRVANGVASEGQKAELRALTIQQKQLENQLLSDYLGNNGGGGNPRPVGQSTNNTTPKTSGLKFVGVR